MTAFPRKPSVATPTEIYHRTQRDHQLRTRWKLNHAPRDFTPPASTLQLLPPPATITRERGSTRLTLFWIASAVTAGVFLLLAALS